MKKKKKMKKMDNTARLCGQDNDTNIQLLMHFEIWMSSKMQ